MKIEVNFNIGDRIYIIKEKVVYLIPKDVTTRTLQYTIESEIADGIIVNENGIYPYVGGWDGPEEYHNDVWDEESLSNKYYLSYADAVKALTDIGLKEEI